MTTSWSVVLATYNGERWLPALLDSLIDQSEQPAEVVVVDDASGDGTLTLLETWAKRAPFPVTVLTSASNRGSTSSFERGLAAASGDVIALCDQDDVWRADKLQVLSERFSRAEVMAAFSDLSLIDARSRLIPGSAWESERVGFTKAEQAHFDSSDAFEMLLEHNFVTGAALAVRRSVVELALPFPTVLWATPPWKIHDGWLAVLAAALGNVDAVPEMLVAYRQHDDQQLGLVLGHEPQSAEHSERLAWRADAAAAIHDRLIERGAPVRPRNLDRLSNEISHLRLRGGLPRNPVRRIAVVAGEGRRGGYRRWSAGWKGVLRDLVGV